MQHLSTDGDSIELYEQEQYLFSSTATLRQLSSLMRIHPSLGWLQFVTACRVYQEIWKSGKLYEYPVSNLDNVKSSAGPLTDGWGITTDQTSLIMSDGSATLSWVDPATKAVQRTISVSYPAFPQHCRI